MAPSPSKGKGIHKSSGKIFRRKEQDNTRQTSSGSHANNGSGSSNNGSNGSNNGSSKKEDSNGNSNSSNSSSTSSNAGFSASSSLDLKESALTLPVMAAIDHSKHLPRYSNLCSGESLSMEELDNLQLELELLASSILVRQSAVSAQLGVIEHLEKGKPPPKPQYQPSWGGKRIKTEGDGVLRPSKKAKDSTGKARDVTHLPPAPSHHVLPPPPPSKIPKVKCSIVGKEPLFDVPDLPSSEPPRPPPPRNDITNRFWSMVDTYCQEMTADDIKMLEDLISAHNDDPDIYKIQPLGKHYTLRWAQEDILDEQKEGSKLADNNGSKKKGTSTNDVSDKLLREVDLNHSTADDTGPLGPLAQRLLAGLVEEKVLQQPENAENKAGAGVGRPGFLRSLGLGSGAGLEKRLRKELQDHGLIEPDQSGQEDDDEILQELRRCQSELRGVASHNHTQLTRLLALARDALYRHDLKKKLRDAEAKVIEAYKNISSMRAKKKPPSKKDKDVAWKAIKDREVIVRQLDSLSSS